MSRDEAQDPWLVRARDVRPETPGGCPPDDLLAAYLAGAMEEGLSERLAEHTVFCARCGQSLAELAAIAREAEEGLAPAHPIVTAGTGAARRVLHPARWWRPAIPVLAAAAAVAAFVVLSPAGAPSGVDLPAWSPSVSNDHVSRDLKYLRSVDPSAPAWLVARPKGRVLEFDAFVWPPVAGATHYVVNVFDSSGNLRWSHSGLDRNWLRPSRSERTSVANETVYWQVVAYGPQGQLALSDRVELEFSP